MPPFVLEPHFKVQLSPFRWSSSPFLLQSCTWSRGPIKPRASALCAVWEPTSFLTAGVACGLVSYGNNALSFPWDSAGSKIFPSEEPSTWAVASAALPSMSCLLRTVPHRKAFPTIDTVMLGLPALPAHLFQPGLSHLMSRFTGMDTALPPGPGCRAV